MLKRKAIITVTSRQIKDDSDIIEVVTPGYFYKKGSVYYAVYKETKISGMEDTTTTLKISGQKLLLIRTGNTTAKMEFSGCKENISMYNTPYGTIELKIDTIKIKTDINENGGDVTIDYNMSLSGQSPQYTKLMINVKVQ